MNKFALVLPAVGFLAGCSVAPTEAPELSARLALIGNSTVTVTEASVVRQAMNTAPTHNWVLYTKAGTPPTAGEFVVGPAAPPLGVGSYRSRLTLGSEKVFLFNYDHLGTALTSISALSYSTYKDAASTFPFPSINIQIDINGGTFVPGDFRTLVFEPYYQPGFVDASGVWEARDAYNGGAAKWWSTGATTCPQSAPCTWNDLIASYPGATILGGFGINAGSGNAGIDGSVDALSIAYGGGSVTYNFEPYETATTKDSCKDGGWMTVKRADGSSFTNQGDCVSYVNTGN